MTETPLPSIISSHHRVTSSCDAGSPSMLNDAATLGNSPNHPYECIPECRLTMTRHHHPSVICQYQHRLYQRPSTCSSSPYPTFSRLFFLSGGATRTSTSTSDSSQCTCSPLPASATVAQEESSIPLLASPISKESHQTEERLMSTPSSMIIIQSTQ